MKCAVWDMLIFALCGIVCVVYVVFCLYKVHDEEFENQCGVLDGWGHERSYMLVSKYSKCPFFCNKFVSIIYICV